MAIDSITNNPIYPYSNIYANEYKPIYEDEARPIEPISENKYEETNKEPTTPLSNDEIAAQTFNSPATQLTKEIINIYAVGRKITGSGSFDFGDINELQRLINQGEVLDMMPKVEEVEVGK